MRILHVNKFFDFRGGVEVYLHQVMQKQAALGHDVHILSSRAPTNLATPDQKYFIHRYDFSKFENWKLDMKKARAFLWNVEAKRATERVLSELQPDVVHLHNIYHHFSSSILAPIRASGVRCVQTLHDLKLACPNYSMFTQGAVCERCKGGKYWNTVLHSCLSSSTVANTLGMCEMYLTKIRKSYERTVHRFISPSDFHRNTMVEWGEPANKFVVIRNPAEISSVPAERGGGYVLYTGRITYGKGVETMIRAAARVPTLSLKIAGTGPDEERFRHLARTIGASNVQFLGFIPPAELAPIRRLADAVVVPSIHYENSPLAVLEGMGDGIPVLASKIGGIPELIRDEEEGLLAVPGNEDAWVATFQHFLRLPLHVRASMGEHGRARIAQRHSWGEHLEALHDVYTGA